MRNYDIVHYPGVRVLMVEDTKVRIPTGVGRYFGLGDYHYRLVFTQDSGNELWELFQSERT